MMKNETRPTDAEKLRSGTPRQQRHGQWSLTLLAGLILVAISGPVVWAKVSNTTGPINGTAPTVTGTLSVMFPGGATAVTNYATVGTAMKPTDFGVSTSGLTLQDPDGDSGLSSSIDTAAVTWDWKYDNMALTSVQLTAPFSTNFLGKTLTVAVSAPVTASSLTGVPTTGNPSTLSSATYSLVVPASLPVVRVNGVSFALDSGFPKTGFSQATFQFWMNGTSNSGNSNYTFAADPQAPWVTVNATLGVVTFTGIPTAAQTVNITITDNRGGPATTFSFRVGTWFINKYTTTATAAGADSYCATQPGYSVPSYLSVTNAALNGAGTRAPDGRLWDEWGDLGYYGESAWVVGSSHWALESDSDGRYGVFLLNGMLGHLGPIYSSKLMCSRTL